MNRAEYLAALRRALSVLPEEERASALSYYEEYFDDAGPENEAKAIEELRTMARRQEDWCAQSRDKYAELNRQFCQKLALAQQTLAQPDLSGFHEMEEGLHRLEESFGEKPAAEKNEQ